MKKEFWNKNKRYIRGIVLDKSIDIEESISEIIKNFLCKKNLKDFFKKELLDKPFFTFGEKSRILGKIIKHLDLLNSEEAKKFNRLMRECIEDRNKLAHKKIYFPIESKEQITFNVQEDGQISIKEEILKGGDKFTFLKKGEKIKNQVEDIKYDKIITNFDEALRIINIINKRLMKNLSKRRDVKEE